MQPPPPSEDPPPSLLHFSLFVLLSLLWSTTLISLIPRLLGRLLSFAANRWSSNTHIRISSLYLYPLSGRAVAHSVHYTVPDAALSVEELVLQVRWWRPAPDSPFATPLELHDPHTLDPLAAAAADAERAKAAPLLRRLAYRLRRAWFRAAPTRVANHPTEPPPLISLLLAGLRVRVVNVQRNHNHLQKLLQLAAAHKSPEPSPPDPPVPFADLSAAALHQAASGASYSHDDPIPGEKPFWHRVAELASLRITGAAIYFCDLAQSPLTRVMLSSAKLRYRYGAPASPQDMCRKRFLISISALRISVAPASAVAATADVAAADPSRPPPAPAAPPVFADSTDALIRHVLRHGHRALTGPSWRRGTSSVPHSMPEKDSRVKRALHGTRRRASSLRHRASGRDMRATQSKITLPVSDILRADTAVIDYVFDEPGPSEHLTASLPARRRVRRRQEMTDAPTQDNTDGMRDDLTASPPPVNRASVLLRGCSFSYHSSAIADIERIMERLQPAVYDLMPFAMQLHTKDGQRAPTGLQIEIDATPALSATRHAQSLVMLPFDPRQNTWRALSALRVRQWPSGDGKNQEKAKSGSDDARAVFPESSVDIHGSKISLRTEIPYKSGVQQKTIITVSDVKIDATGVAPIPMCNARSLTVVRVVKYPSIWNEVHSVMADVHFEDANITYVPDTVRIIDDVAATIRENSKKPRDVRYFVPFKETTKLRADSGCCITLACSSDNSWEDIHSGLPDSYGKMKLCGERFELLLTPSAPTEYNGDSAALTWTLSLPYVKGTIELPLPLSKNPSGQKTANASQRSRAPSGEQETHQNKSRSSMLARRVRSQLESIGGYLHPDRSVDVKMEHRTVEIDILEVGHLCQLMGKVVTHVSHDYLDIGQTCFLDCVNRSDLSVSMSTVTFDLNPHHVSHILNLIDNYAGCGMPALSIEEKNSLLSRRRSIAGNLLYEKRYPTREECAVIGMGIGPISQSADSLKVMDEVFCLDIDIESLLVRVHELPHPLSPFKDRAQNSCSLDLGHVCGTLAANRLGSTFEISPVGNPIVLYGGYLEPDLGKVGSRKESGPDRMTHPSATVDKLLIRKGSLSCRDWGLYSSDISIEIGNVCGCLLDNMAVSLTKIVIAALPDPEMEEQLTSASLLVLHTIELTVESADLLVLSSASDAWAERSGQRNRSSAISSEVTSIRGSTSGSVPALLMGVTQVQFPRGIRFCSSNYATEHAASRSRTLLPDMAFDVFMSWGGALTPWVDEATMRAQVAHASGIKAIHHQTILQGAGLLRKVVELHECTIDVTLDARPSLWSDVVQELQRSQIVRQSQETRDVVPGWFSESSDSTSNSVESTLHAKDLGSSWWVFLGLGRQASIIGNYLDTTPVPAGTLECLSVAAISDIMLVIAPESLELANDIVIRCREVLWNRGGGDIKGSLPESMSWSRNQFSTSDLMDAWHSFESSRQPNWMMSGVEDIDSIVILRGLETKVIQLMLLSPILLGEGPGRASYASLEGPIGDVCVCAPLGLHTLAVERLQSVEMLTINEDVHTYVPSRSGLHTSVKHVSIPALLISCNEREVGDVLEIVFVFRKQTKAAQESRSKRPMLKEKLLEERHSLVGKVSSVSIGRTESGLECFASFGRIVSIFVLLCRAFGLELSSLSEFKDSRIQNLYRKVLKLSPDDVRSRSPGEVRNRFCDVVRSAQEVDCRETEGTSAVGGTIGLNHSGQSTNILAGEKKDSSHVSSVDLTLQSFSLEIANDQLLQIESVTCKGGSSCGLPSPAIVEGLVLNTSVGTIHISLRDDVAADTLRMVSEVASFVRRATFSMPMLRYEGNVESRGGNCKRSELNPQSQNDGGSRKGRPMSHFLQSLHFSNHGRRRTHFAGFSQSPFRRRKSNSHLREKLRSGQDSSSPLGGADGRVGVPTRGVSPFSALLHLKDHGKFSASQVPMEQNEETNSNGSGSQSVKRKSRELHRPVFDAGAGSHRLLPTSSEVRNQFRDLPRSLHASNPALRDNDQNYTYAAVRTAGEAGPPRKKSKSRVRIAPIVPPAFTEDYRFRQSMRKEDLVASTSSTMPGESDTFGNESQNVKSMSPHHVSLVSSVRSGGHKNDKLEPRFVQAASLVRSRQRRRQSVTVFVSCGKVVSHYYRRKNVGRDQAHREARTADIRFSVYRPRLTFMKSPPDGSQSLVMTASSAKLESTNDPNCLLTGSITSIRVIVSLAQGFAPSNLPKMITSVQVSEFRAKLHAADLQSVLRFREEFKQDLKAVLLASVITKSSITEMARATRLSTAKDSQSRGSHFSTIAFDLLCEQSLISLEGFHPKEKEMSISYFLDGIFFSIAASEQENAALTLGLRLYGHGLSITAPAWVSDERFHFPSLDARGVQWAETTGLPTLLKVSAEPLVNSTSIQGLRHVIFTVSGLLAFQSTAGRTSQHRDAVLRQDPAVVQAPRGFQIHLNDQQNATGSTPFTRSFAAWERTKGVRMDISIRPMSISLTSGQVVALFDVGAIIGVFEWNKLVSTGVQLHSSVNVPRVSLMYMRMPSSDFSFVDIQPDERRASLSIALEKARIDVLKTQEELTHTFTFRIDIVTVLGQVRPWRLMLDAAVWADEQEFVSDLQAINYGALAASKQRDVKNSSPNDEGTIEHRVVLIGAKIQRFILAVPLLDAEEYSSRLALRATELHILVRHRFDNLPIPRKNVLDVKSHFIGILWDNAALLSSHHSRITIGLRRSSSSSNALFGELNVVLVAGTWRICPRKDVIVALLDAKNGKENRDITERTREIFGSLPEVLSKAESSVAGDSASITTEKQERLLFESLQLKILRTSGFIEGLEGDWVSNEPTVMDGKNTLRRYPSTNASKFSVPAFSIAVVRSTAQDFDLVDVDFSGREGEFPRGCLRKTANIFSELFGAVASDREEFGTNNAPTKPTEQPPTVSRDLTILVRFGKSLYRAQELVTPSLQAKFCFFAGRSSALLASVSTKPLFDEDVSHTTVITGISPKLALEISPVIEGTKMQSLRLLDGRFMHGLSSSFPPHTLIHITRVTALMEAKTLLLAQGRMSSLHHGQQHSSGTGSSAKAKSAVPDAQGNVMLVLGKHQRRNASSGKEIGQDSPEVRVEPDVRLQLKLTSKSETPANQVDFVVERLHAGLSRTLNDGAALELPLRIHLGLHGAFLRGQWDHLSCNLRLKENLLCVNASQMSPRNGGLTLIANIMNRLQFESMQYEKHTLKLEVDALAAIWAVPKRDILIESTTVKTEVSYTLRKAVSKLTSQLKKLQNEVKLLQKEGVSQESSHVGSGRASSVDSRPTVGGSPSNDIAVNQDKAGDVLSVSSTKSTSSSPATPFLTKKGLLWQANRTKIFIKGDEVRITMRGYQFEESQHSGTVICKQYQVSYEYEAGPKRNVRYRRNLDIDFSTMSIAYNDDERGIHSDLFSIPNPCLRLKVTDSMEELNVELLGDLLVRLGHGLFYWQDFKTLAELTVQGIAAHQDPAGLEPFPAAIKEDVQPWEGRVPNANVDLNPRIDVIGDLTQDMWQIVEKRLGRVDVIPAQMYEFVIVPLEALSQALCDPLMK